MITKVFEVSLTYDEGLPYSIGTAEDLEIDIEQRILNGSREIKVRVKEVTKDETESGNHG